MSVRPSVCVMCFSDNNGGMELDTIKLARLLNDTCEVTVLCKQDSFVHQRVELEKDIDFVPIRFLSRMFSPAMLFSVRKVLKTKNIMNVVFFGASELKTLYFSFLGFDLNVIVRHGTTKSHKKNSLIHKLIYRCVSFHVAISKHLLDNVKHIIPVVNKVNYKVIYPSFDVAGCRDSREVENDTVQLVHIGRLAPGKGQDDAIVACKKLYENNIEFKLSFIGSSEEDKYMDGLKLLADASGYGESIEFLGYSNNVSEYLARADIFLFPSHGEGFGNVFIEAMSCGLSVVSYDNTTFPEFFGLGFKFRMATDRDLDSLAGNLLDAVMHLDEERLVFEQNMVLVESLFSRERERRDWLSIFV